MLPPVSPQSRSGYTFAEVLVAILLLAVFFMSIFQLNAICLRYINATKETVGAQQIVHDRGEALRNLAFSDLTTTSYLQTLLTAPANNSDITRKLTEVIKISNFPTWNGGTQFTRNSNGSVSVDTVATDLGSALVHVSVTATWNMTLGGRARDVQINTVVANGTKK